MSVDTSRSTSAEARLVFTDDDDDQVQVDVGPDYIDIWRKTRVGDDGLPEETEGPGNGFVHLAFDDIRALLEAMQDRLDFNRDR